MRLNRSTKTSHKFTYIFPAPTLANMRILRTRTSGGKRVHSLISLILHTSVCAFLVFGCSKPEHYMYPVFIEPTKEILPPSLGLRATEGTMHVLGNRVNRIGSLAVYVASAKVSSAYMNPRTWQPSSLNNSHGNSPSGVRNITQNAKRVWKKQNHERKKRERKPGREKTTPQKRGGKKLHVNKAK